jgi:hypothetical protein
MEKPSQNKRCKQEPIPTEYVLAASLELECHGEVKNYEAIE